MKPEPQVDKLLEDKLSFLSKEQDKKYEKLNLQFNPFPKSGTANVNSSDFYTQHLEPFNVGIKEKILDYIAHCFSINVKDPKDKLNTAVITGDYGLGKTQLLMYAKYLLGIISQDAKINRKPYVIYVDNPGAKLSEFIGTIIDKIGEESFRKFIWNKIIQAIVSSNVYKDRLKKFRNTNAAMLPNYTDPYDPSNTVNHKAFLDAWHSGFASTKAKKEFDEEFRKIKLEILQTAYTNPGLAEYFYDIVSTDLGINKSWEALSSGNIKLLEKKEYLILKCIVDLIKEQGFTDFFILVDEFEDLTKGRLTKSQVDNYLYNLRLLLDGYREWCLLFAMTGEALTATRKLSPPLADRIGMSVISLTKLLPDQVQRIALNYLNLARPNDNRNLFPFTIEALQSLNEKVEGSTRRFLKSCYNIIEKAAEKLQQGQNIDQAFVLANYNVDFD
jgi:Cdc6-like AAA superfamily ATPase